MANEVRLIDANALFFKLVNTDPNTPKRFCDGVATAMEFILNAPTIDPESLAEYLRSLGYEVKKCQH